MEAGSSGTRSYLQTLITTRYIPSKTTEDDFIEVARAIGCDGPVCYDDDDVITADGYGDNAILVEDTKKSQEKDCEEIHVDDIEESPKAILQKEVIPLRCKDEAELVLQKIMTCPEELLRTVKYDYYNQRWFNTTRESEINLTSYVLRHPNARPQYFSMQCRHMTLADVGQLLLLSQTCEPRITGQCIVRLAIKPSDDFSFAVLMGLLNRMIEEHAGFTIEDVSVVATMTISSNLNKKNVHRLHTKDYEEYAKLEDRLDSSMDIMSSRASITCKVKGKKHALTRLTYFNNGCMKDDEIMRNRYIELEQCVKTMNRRIIIDEMRNESVEFEVENQMVSLKLGIPPVEDLVSYLKTGQLEFETTC